MNITVSPGFAMLTGARLPIDLLLGCDRVDARTRILRLQAAMQNLPQVDCPLKHHFAPDAYAREILLPKGSLVIGKIHRHRHVNVISKGRVTVYTEAGKVDLEAPVTFISEVGTKRVVLAHEDTVWTTVHVTAETDLEKIEDYVIAKSYDALELGNEVLKVEE